MILLKMFGAYSLTDYCSATIVGAAFIPVVWIFGSSNVAILEKHNGSGGQAPDNDCARPLVSRLAHQGNSRARRRHGARAARHMVVRALHPQAKIVRGIIDNSISTELGGVRAEITVAFTDVRDFTAIAESAGISDVLMHQMSRYFSVLAEAFLAEGGTVDKFIGDAVMVFWNAPNPQPDHVERACRAALAGRAACDKLNSQFEAEGLKPFFTRFGIHVGDAVVGNLGSMEAA